MEHDSEEVIVVGVDDIKRQRRVLRNDGLIEKREVFISEEGKVGASNSFVSKVVRGQADRSQ